MLAMKSLWFQVWDAFGKSFKTASNNSYCLKSVPISMLERPETSRCWNLFQTHTNNCIIICLALCQSFIIFKLSWWKTEKSVVFLVKRIIFFKTGITSASFKLSWNISLAAMKFEFCDSLLNWVWNIFRLFICYKRAFSNTQKRSSVFKKLVLLYCNVIVIIYSVILLMRIKRRYYFSK